MVELYISANYVVNRTTVSQTTLSYSLEVVRETVDFGRDDLDQGEPEGDPAVAVLGAVKVRYQSIVQLSLKPAT